MDEPLFDGITAAIVLFGAASVIVLKNSALADVANPQRVQRFQLIGHLLLGIAVCLLLYRWIAAVTSLPLGTRPNVWRSGALSAVCGIGLAAAVKAVVGASLVSQVRYFVIAATCGAIALLVASVGDWALLLLTILAVGVGFAKWAATHTRLVHPTNDDAEPAREPTLVLIVSAALLLLLLGTWQHVIEYETQRKTRSSRYSAWPRATALRNAWERTGWAAKTGDETAAARVAHVASREQRIALGLGALLLVVVIASLRRASEDATTSEADHAG